MRRLLVPTDFSPNAECALRVAVDIAQRDGATIILYHIYLPVESPFIDNKSKREEYNSDTETIVLKRMQRLTKKVLKDMKDVTISSVIGRSPLLNNILGFAEHNHIDMIVMGTKGASGIKKMLLGSVAAKVAEKSDIPVLLIPEQFSPKVLAQITFASDYHPYDQEALKFTLAFAKLFNGKVTVSHVLNADEPEKEIERKKNAFDTYAYYMQRKFSENNLKFELVEAGSKQGKIETLYKKVSYDLLVLVRRKKTFFQKIFSPGHAKSAACMAKKPLLVIPPVGKRKTKAN